MSNEKIEAAITRAAKPKRAALLTEAKIRITHEAIVVKKDGELAFSRGEKSDPQQATLLIFDPKLRAYRPVLTPPGTSWELVEKRQGPGIWTPGKPT